MEHLRDSKTLKALGMNEKNQWILYDEKPKGFIEHLSSNIDNNNILSEIELKQYEELCAACQFLEGDTLLEELKALESHFPGILTANDEEIETAESELKFLENGTRERKNRIKRMENSEKKQLKVIEAIEKRHFELNYQHNHLEKDSMQKSNVLSELQKTNQNRIVDLKNIYTLTVCCK
jgi:HAUS augmin-like complex subunit 3